MTVSVSETCGEVDALTPEALIQRLLEVYGAPTLDDLRGHVPNSVRTLERWKQVGWPKSAGALLELLNAAALLKPLEDGAAGDETDRSARVLAGLAASVATLVESHREALADLESVHTRLGRAAAALAGRQAAPARKPTRKRAT